MSNTNQIIDLTEALEYLKADLIPRLDLYKVNREDESETLPAALAVTEGQLRSLRVVVDFAAMIEAGNFKFLATNAYGWAFGDTPADAAKNCKRHIPSGAGHLLSLAEKARRAKCDIKLVHADTKADSMNIEYAVGMRPVEMKRRVS